LAKYKALDYRRKLQKHQIADTHAPDDQLQASSDSVEKEVLSKESLNDMIRVINGFNELDRKIFYKRYFYYESIESIAEQFHLSRQAVDNRLWRSRKMLKEALNYPAKEGEDYEKIR
jgi:RNA polymerase sigma-70 factor (ECF subfamily)